MAKSGFSRFHWIGLLVPLLAALSPMGLSRLADLVPKIPQPLFAVLAGGIVAAVCWVLFTFVPFLRETHSLGKAVLLGALTTEVLIFHASTLLPTMTNITLFLFFYFNTVELLDSGSLH